MDKVNLKLIKKLLRSSFIKWNFNLIFLDLIEFEYDVINNDDFDEKESNQEVVELFTSRCSFCNHFRKKYLICCDKCYLDSCNLDINMDICEFICDAPKYDYFSVQNICFKVIGFLNGMKTFIKMIEKFGVDMNEKK